MDYNKIYANWEDLPDCRVYLPDESLWGKKLPDNTYGINNVPMFGVYRYHDIVKSQNIVEDRVDDLLAHRRWNGMFMFSYKEPEGSTEEESIEIRQKIFEALQDVGLLGFMWKGLAYLMCETDHPRDHIYPIIIARLDAIGVEHPPYNPTK